MTKIVFRPYRGDDREERLESDALQMAIENALPGQVTVADIVPADATHFFGRKPRRTSLPDRLVYPTREHTHIPYWEWDAFLSHTNRGFWTLPLDAAIEKVDKLHTAGKDAFVKSTKLKQFVASVPRGTTLTRELEALICSFIDSGPDLMVQEHVEVRSEYRISVVDGVAITGSGKVMAHTPQDNPGEPFTTFIPDRWHGPDADPALVGLYRAIANEVIAGTPAKSYALDMGLIDGRPGIVEINPLQLGQVGLFACDVDRLVAAVLASCGLKLALVGA